MTRRVYGADLIAAERARQQELEGWSSEHDDQHTDGELVWAAIAYAMPTTDTTRPEALWPWDPQSFKPKDRVRDLVRAGALLAAEIDRVLRVTQTALLDERPPGV